MPISLNSIEYNGSSPEHNTTSTLRQRVKTTNKMVDDALIQLHSAKGVTLKQMYSYMLSTYALDSITSARVLRIKKRLNELRESEDLMNKTGKGFTGHLKLVHKEKFLRKVKANEKQLQMGRKTKHAVSKDVVKTVMKKTQDKSKKLNTKSNKEPIKRKIQRPPIASEQHTPVVPRQTTPIRANVMNHKLCVSMFDTPVAMSSLHHSTPCVETTVVPQAPDIRGITTRKRVLHPTNGEAGGTPRTSLPGKKRKTQKRV